MLEYPHSRFALCNELCPIPGNLYQIRGFIGAQLI